MCIFFSSVVKRKTKRLNEGFVFVFLFNSAQTAQLAANDSEISHMEIGKMHKHSARELLRLKKVH